MFDNAADIPAELGGVDGRAIAPFNTDTALAPLPTSNDNKTAQSLPIISTNGSLDQLVELGLKSADSMGLESDLRSGEMLAKAAVTAAGHAGADPSVPSSDPSSDDLLTGGLSSSAHTIESDAAQVDFDGWVGAFSVGDRNQVEIDFLFDGGGYEGQLAVFNLAGMRGLAQRDFVSEAARRASSNSAEGQVVILDALEGAQFSGELGESDVNSGAVASTKTLSLAAGNLFAVMLVPNGTVEDVLAGSQTPFFSVAAFNPNGDTQTGKAAEGVFAFEDLVFEGSDRDFNDIIFRVTGATDNITNLSELIDINQSWVSNPVAQQFLKTPTFSEDTPDQPVDNENGNPDQPTAPPAEVPPIEQPPAEQPPTEQPPVQPAEETPPVAEMPVEEEVPAEEVPTEEVPAEETPSTPTSPAAPPTSEQPTNEQPTGENPVDENPTGENPADENPDEEPPAPPAPEPAAPEPTAPEQPVEDSSPAEPPAQEEPTEELPAEDPPTQELPAEEQPMEESPAEEPVEVPPSTPSAPLAVSAISTNVAKFNGNSTEAEIIASGAQTITIGTQRIYIGTEQVTSINQNPIIRSFDSANPNNNWTRRDLETSGTDGRGLGLLWTGSGLYGVFSVDGTQTDGQDFRRATGSAKQSWLKSFGTGQGKIAVLGQIDPNTGDLLNAAHLSAINNGRTNSLFVTGASTNSAGNIVVQAKSFFSPRQPDGSAKTKNSGNTAGSPFDYTVEIRSDLSEVLSTSAPGWT